MSPKTKMHPVCCFSFLFRFVALFFAGAMCLNNVGCSGKEYAEPPTVFPVTGQVVFQDGKPLTGGMVEFQSKTDNSLSVTSEIKPDGRFSLVSRLDGQTFTGASEGEYVVTLFPPQSATQAESPQTLPEIYTVEPKDNEFTLTFPLAAP